MNTNYEKLVFRCPWKD